MNFHLVEIENYEKETYQNAIRKALSESGIEFDLAIVETKEAFRRLPVNENPYWITKALLLQKNITVQHLLASKARRPDIILDAFALQIYAKLGGIPWALQASPNVAHELIVGIGSSYTRSNNYKGAEQNRVVGITTFFTSDGAYIFNSKSREVSYNDYFKELLRNLKTSIDKISNEYGWQESAIVRIVFHVFKPMKNIEVEVVDSLISQYPQFNIKFAFLSFSEGNSYCLFDLAQQGITYLGGTKGKYVPPRGTNRLLHNLACILQLKGPGDVKTDAQGFVGPLLIRVHENSTFRDVSYLVQQVFRLTNVSYRSFFPSQLPVSLLYASLITENLNNLGKITGWNPDCIALLRNKKWFI